MIIEYHRPQNIDEALNLLAREDVTARPLGGGTVLNRPSPDPIAAVDLQALGLDKVKKRGNWLDIGATATLEQLLGVIPLQPVVKQVIQLEGNYNLRQVATAAGTLVAAGGRSPLVTTLLALDIQLTLLPGEEQISLGDLLPMRYERLRGRLITSIALPLNVQLAYEYVARTPADLPQVCVAVARWPSSRTRVTLGGFGKAPVLAMDGPESDGADIAAMEAYRQAGDEWASAEFRREVARTLTRRCLAELHPG